MMDNRSYNQPKSTESSGQSGSANTDYNVNERVDYPRKNYREEYAAEVSPARAINAVSTREDTVDLSRNERSGAATSDATSDAGRTVGYVGVGLGIASLFMWSIILGPLAAIMGFYAYSQGRKVSGGWAIGLGIVATISYFLMLPFTR